MNWVLTETAFDPKTAKAYEGLFTQGSGYLHVRGSLEEHLTDCPQNIDRLRKPTNVTAERFPETKAKWGTYVPGIYGPHPFLNWELINLPWFLDIALFADGEKLDMELSNVRDYKRELNLRTATLKRELTWCTKTGKTLNVLFERFASAARPHLFVQRLNIFPQQDLVAEVSAGIDADVRTNGHDHFQSIDFSRIDDNNLSCAVLTDGNDTVWMQTRLLSRNVGSWEWKQHEKKAEFRAQIQLSSGRPFVLEKRTAVCTSRDLDAASCKEILETACKSTYEDLHAEHCAVWEERWNRSDVVIEGDDESQLAMRCAIYHLLRAHVPNDPRVAIDAKGYAGEAYFGRFFWDTEMYLLPFYLYTDPEKARTLVDFRIRTLPGARDTAASYGYSGAKYPWEADRDGHDSCPNWQYADHEVHVTADVVYGFAHYATATGDRSFLTNEAAEAIVETARYWLQRLDWRKGDNYPSILGVMGPDEYSPITNNNSYTNKMVKFALNLAADIGSHAGASSEECGEFRRAAELLPIPRREDGLVLQCEEFEKLAEPRFEELWKDRSLPFAAQVSQERLYRSKCLKQADVLMMMMLFPKDFTEKEIRTAWEYYLPYTTHDSSLSAGVHAIVACRLGLRKQAWDFWKRTSSLDLDITHGGAAEGIHIANSGASWQVAVFGFAGLATALESDILTIRPNLPDSWKRLTFPIVWKGQQGRVEITHEHCSVTNCSNQPLEIAIWDKKAVAGPGETVTVYLQNQDNQPEPG
ncbi:MAG: glycosyl hydrolase family 65 protein [Armatimonadota bacterium]|nr:glycosyl hydrolase family 65 protein [Armatimonadota bacterium]